MPNLVLTDEQAIQLVEQLPQQQLPTLLLAQKQYQQLPVRVIRQRKVYHVLKVKLRW
jgi:hypothetical protein